MFRSICIYCTLYVILYLHIQNIAVCIGYLKYSIYNKRKYRIHFIIIDHNLYI